MALIALLCLSAPVASAQDPRVTRSEFLRKGGISADQLPLLDAIGILRCGRRQSTATLVGNSRTILAAGHAFFYAPKEITAYVSRKHGISVSELKSVLEGKRDLNERHVLAFAASGLRIDLFHASGKPRRRAITCSFRVRHSLGNGEKARQRIYSVDAVSLFVPPETLGNPAFAVPSNDWVLARLNEDAVGIKPFLMASPPQGNGSGPAGLRNVLNVAGPASNWNNGRDVQRLVRSYQNCDVLAVEPHAAAQPSTLVMSCMAGPGNSGSPVFTFDPATGVPVLHGMITAQVHNGTRAGRAVRSLGPRTSRTMLQARDVMLHVERLTATIDGDAVPLPGRRP